MAECFCNYVQNINDNNIKSKHLDIDFFYQHYQLGTFDATCDLHLNTFMMSDKLKATGSGVKNGEF